MFSNLLDRKIIELQHRSVSITSSIIPLLNIKNETKNSFTDLEYFDNDILIEDVILIYKKKKLNYRIFFFFFLTYFIIT